ncbi:MAG: hypothetical protein Q9171_005180 [Xanthocarpia ochracea]
MPKFINVFKTLPKELFRVNNGPSIRLRAFPKKKKPTGAYDLLTEGGKVKPRGLDPNSYRFPNGASMRPNTAAQKRLVTIFDRSNAVVYSVPAGTKLPGDLLMVHEFRDHYSLQAATEMTVEVSNGATFLPNTFLMQDMIRAHFDEYLEELGSDSAVKSPLIFTIPKG